MFKSQSRGNDQISVKYQVPWSQNHILAGTSKNRDSYDNFFIFNGSSGFSNIIRKETNVKNGILDYMIKLTVDAQDYGWIPC